jgi:hypothetical protein
LAVKYVAGRTLARSLSRCLHVTDSTTTGPFERFIVTVNGEDADKDTQRATIQTAATKNYLSAQNGGGVGESKNVAPVHTNATSAGDFEQFTMIDQ